MHVAAGTELREANIGSISPGWFLSALLVPCLCPACALLVPCLCPACFYMLFRSELQSTKTTTCSFAAKELLELETQGKKIVDDMRQMRQMILILGIKRAVRTAELLIDQGQTEVLVRGHWLSALHSQINKKTLNKRMAVVGNAR